MARRYLVVVAMILAALTGPGIWLKPPLEDMRAGAEGAECRCGRKPESRRGDAGSERCRVA